MNTEPLKAGDPVTLKELEREHIRRTLEEERGKVKAAKRLGIHRTTLGRKIWRLRVAYTVRPRHGE